MTAPGRLLRRAEFLAAAAQGRKWVAPGLIVQMRLHTDADSSTCAVRYGLTASRKVGGAVVRNRARRRLRALAEEILPQAGLPPCDLVLIARHTATVSRKFADLRADLLWSIDRLRPKTTP